MNNAAVKSQMNTVVMWPFSVLAVCFLMLPFFFTAFPPSTDIAQHLCQIHLLKEALAGNTDLYAINWFAPNNLIYLFVAGVEAVFAPPLSSKALLFILALMWIGSCYYLAWSFDRPLESAILATPLIYNLSFYWGFLNFLIGWPFFVLFLAQCHKPVNKKNWLITFLLLFLLFNCHALWFLVSCVFLFIQSLVRWEGKKLFLYRLSASIPTGIVAAIWFPVFSAARADSSFDIAPHWETLPFERVTPTYLTDAMLGGVRGYLEPLFAIAVFLWIAAALYTNRTQLREKCDTTLLLGFALFSAIMLLAPQKFMNTIYFAQRWFPCAVIMLIIALPRPNIKRHWLMLYVMGLIVLFSVETAGIWKVYEKRELAGFEDSLDMLPDEQRVLGLDYVVLSSLIKGRPFIQMPAYAQALKGGSLNFSFAEHSSGIVIYKEPRRIDWTCALEWYADTLKPEDLQYFDYAIVNGKPEMHDMFSSYDSVQPVTEKGRWRLYKLNNASNGNL